MKAKSGFLCPCCGTDIQKSCKFCPECGSYLLNNFLQLGIIRAMDYQRKGQSWNAMEQLKQLTENYPQNAHVHKSLGNIYFHMGMLDWAIDSYRKAIQLDSDYIDAHHSLGGALYHRGHVPEAVTEYQTVLKLDPDYHAAHYRIGLCYHHVGKLNAAIHHFIESTVVTPEYVMAHYHLGVIHYKQGDLEKAEHEFRQVLQADPQDMACVKYLDLISEQLKKNSNGNMLKAKKMQNEP